MPTALNYGEDDLEPLHFLELDPPGSAVFKDLPRSSSSSLPFHLIILFVSPPFIVVTP